MSAVFTKTDKALIDRAARHLKDEAENIKRANAVMTWAASEESKKAKRVYDRLLRDERDLRMLARRLEKLVPAAVYPAPGPGTMLTTGGDGFDIPPAGKD